MKKLLILFLIFFSWNITWAGPPGGGSSKAIERNQLSGSQLVQITDSEGHNANIDATTESFIVIGFERYKIHQGEAFIVHLDGDPTDIDNGIAIGFTTDNSTEWHHMVIVADCEDICTVTVEEATNAFTDSETDTAYFLNRNRNMTVDATTWAITANAPNPSVDGQYHYWDESDYTTSGAGGAAVVTGTEIYHEHIGQTGNPQTSSGGLSRDQTEIVLKANTEYVFKVNSDTANNNHVNLNLTGYQHTNSN